MEIMQSTEKERVALAKERIEMLLGGKQEVFLALGCWTRDCKGGPYPRYTF